ncbi:TPA: hypothetical protein ACID4M_003346 [Pseudomonas aeruginosa]
MSGSKGKSSNTVSDTPEQRYAAQVAAEKWNYAQERLAPVENAYMGRVDQMGSGGNMAYVRGKANAGTQQALRAGMEQVTQGVTQQAGVNPNSGRYTGAMADLADAAGAGGGDTMARAQFEQKAQQVGGLSNQAAIGQGQSGQAQAGLNTVANQAAQDAQSAAFNRFNRKSANLQLAGAALGAGAAGAQYGLQNWKSTPASTSVARSGVLNPEGLNGKQFDTTQYGVNFGSYA